MTLRAAALLGAALALSTSACSVSLDKTTAGAQAQNACSSNSDCGADGECSFGACVAHDGQLSSVLLEIAPPANVKGVGGIRYLQTLTGLDRSSEARNIELQQKKTITGFVLAPSTQCARTFAVDVTFTPREEAYGLGIISYVARTTRRNVSEICAEQAEGVTELDEFSVELPSGSYDVYVKPLVATGEKGAPECNLVPQLYRGVTFDDPGDSCLRLRWTASQTLQVVVPWNNSFESLDGWAIEVVHPYTAQVLSAKELLAPEELKQTPDGPRYEHSIAFTPTDEAGKEIVRLTPPAGVVAPVIQAERIGLQATSSDSMQAVFPAFGPFPAPVTLSGWVYEERSGDDAAEDVPAPATVSFTATTLAGIKDGIFASYSTTVTVEKNGALVANVLPGKYRTRVVPEVGTRLAATQLVTDVKCDASVLSPDACAPRNPNLPPTVRGGQTLRVPRAATVSGVVVDAVTGDRVNQVTVEALPADTTTRSCTPGTDGSCSLAVIDVIDVARGEGAFVPRTVSDVAPSGTFSLTGLDCGECKENAGATFDIVARPPEASRRAWAVSPRVVVSGGIKELDPIEVSLPILHRGTVQIPQSGASPLPVGNAHLSAFVFRDADGRVITNPRGIQPCTTVAPTAAGGATPSCIRSVLQVAETWADPLGNYELVLPSALLSGSR